MLLRAELRAFIVQQLITAATAAGPRVYENKAIPTAAAALPGITISTPLERKEPLSRGSTLYTTVITVQISARTSGATDALAANAGDDLVEQIIDATAGNQALLSFEGMQQIAAIESAISIRTDGGIVIADIEIGMQCELIERIDPTMPVPLTDINGTVTTADGASLQFDVPLT